MKTPQIARQIEGSYFVDVNGNYWINWNGWSQVKPENSRALRWSIAYQAAYDLTGCAHTAELAAWRDVPAQVSA